MAEKEIINQHIAYVNRCTHHINAISLSVEKLNGTCNEQLKNPERYVNIPFPLAKPMYPKNPWVIPTTFQELQEEFKMLATLRESLDTTIKTELEDFYVVYQKLFLEMKPLLEKLNRITAKISGKENIDAYAILYDSLKAYEKKIFEITLLNDEFTVTSQRLFGTEKLPKALVNAQSIAFLSKRMIQQIRQKQRLELSKTLSDYQKITNEVITANDLRALERFGDFDYLDNQQIQSRRNIQRDSEYFYKLATSYTKKEKPLCQNARLVTYGYEYCFLDRMLYYFNDFSASSFASKYNNYIKRAQIPVLKLISEVAPFKMQPSSNDAISDTTVTVEVAIKTESEMLDTNNISSLDGALINNLVLLLDVSGSMRQNEKLDKLKHSIAYLIDILRPEDKLTIITYSGTAKKVLETTTNYDRTAVKKLINELKSEGKTNAKSGLKLAYEEAVKSYVSGGNNRIIIASDGDFPIDGNSKKNIKKKAKEGIYLSTFQYVNRFPKVNNILKNLAQIGRGRYHQIHNKEDAVKILVSESKQ
ncbi:vWA domain-containing protein [Aquimarina aggregata]|uniref:vWA domain-containing protein n=1 Tax=Aquimarina aggregata TaxID=1642818 RepID=UPI002492FF5B|nr:VWA domain-containing protein [Aquimarina aggregata]